jgi:hypothetical protein
MSDEVDRVKVHLVVAGWYWATPGRDGYQGAETAADCARLDEEMLSDGSAGAVDALTWADEMTGASIYGYDRLAALETVASVARRAVDAIDGATWAEAYPIVAELDAALGNLEEAP